MATLLIVLAITITILLGAQIAKLKRIQKDILRKENPEIIFPFDIVDGQILLKESDNVRKTFLSSYTNGYIIFDPLTHEGRINIYSCDCDDDDGL